MRECLGWISNCPDDRRCPQNWLELAATELPTTVRCHVCDREVQLVPSASTFESNLAADVLTAFPVVPCAGAPASEWRAPGEAAVSSAAPALVPMPASATQALPSEPAQRPAPVLYCVLSSGDAVKIDKDTLIVGRSRTCDVVIPSAKVSRQHASITRANGDYYIEDLGSANGVWKDGEKVGRTKINAGDVFTISEETLTFERR